MNTKISRACFLLLSLWVGTTLAAEDERYHIALLGQTLAPPAGVDASLCDSLARRLPERDSKIHLLVQLYEAPDDLRRRELARRGVELGQYVAGEAWIAAVSAAGVRQLATLPEVRWATPWTPERKLHPRVAARDFGGWARNRDNPGWVMLFVQLHQDVALDELHRLAGEVGGVAAEPIEILHGGTVWVPEERAGDVARFEEVFWIEEGAAPLSATNDGIRANTRANAMLAAPYDLHGAGVRLFVYDAGTVRPSHQTFSPNNGRSRVVRMDSQPANHHPTHVAGTAAGDGSGSASGRGRGIADRAMILSAGHQASGPVYFWDNSGDIAADYALARQVYSADLANTSLGSNPANNGFPCAIEGDYGVAARLLDDIVLGQNAAAGGPITAIFAAGNERDAGSPIGRCGSSYRTIAPPACAKNPIQVGATYSDGGAMTPFSGWGPCDDGRLKPVVTAPGCESGRVTAESAIYSSVNANDSSYGFMCGTSMAAPAVSGIVALWIEDWRSRGFGGPYDQPSPDLVKAFLIHTAKDLGQRGPDFIYGYGAVDAKALIDTLRAGAGNLSAGGPTVWGNDSVKNGQVDTWPLHVPAGTATLKASLAWSDPAASLAAADSWVNDLTLQLVSPAGAVFDAFVLDPANPHLEAGSGLNFRDNQEQVLVRNPVAGNWTVRVTGTHVTAFTQDYGLVFEAQPPSYDPESCQTQAWGFETGNDNFALTGASRVAAPASGHGSFSLRFGAVQPASDEAWRSFTISTSATRAALTYFVYMRTTGIPPGLGRDYFDVEVRGSSGTVLAVVDRRSDAWKAGFWMRQYEIDLTPWAGQTVQLAFRATDVATTPPTSFWLDSVSIQTCGL